MKPRPIALAASRRRRYSALKNFMVPHRCASASATSIRATDAPARWMANVVLGDRHAKLARRGKDIAAVVAGTADDAACFRRRAPPCRRRARGIARHDKAAVPGDGSR